VKRKRFGTTWWGAAWLAALEGQAALDPNRLPRGRTYARSGAVGPPTVGPGEARALVRGSRPAPYRVRVTVTTFDDAQWDRILDAIRVGHAAALLDGELPPEITDEVAVLPGPHELTVRCSCPDRAVPCKHAAALCYVLADLLDRDPFTLLLLRGRTREQILTALRARRAEAPAAPHGVPAADAYARERPPLPAPLPPPAQPGTPVPLPPHPTGDRAAGAAAVPLPPHPAGDTAAEAAAALATAAVRRARALLG
jgi:uncharacterized Zn finger protein